MKDIKITETTWKKLWDIKFSNKQKSMTEVIDSLIDACYKRRKHGN